MGSPDQQHQQQQPRNNNEPPTLEAPIDDVAAMLDDLEMDDATAQQQQQQQQPENEDVVLEAPHHAEPADEAYSGYKMILNDDDEDDDADDDDEAADDDNDDEDLDGDDHIGWTAEDLNRMIDPAIRLVNSARMAAAAAASATATAAAAVPAQHSPAFTVLEPPSNIENIMRAVDAEPPMPTQLAVASSAAATAAAAAARPPIDSDGYDEMERPVRHFRGYNIHPDYMAQIKTAMENVTLKLGDVQPPEWARVVPEEEWMAELMQRVRGQQQPTNDSGVGSSNSLMASNQQPPTAE